MMQKQNMIFEMQHVSFCYPGSRQQALTDISLSLSCGSFTVLCGQSGCGKSTLLRHMKKDQIPYGKGSGQLWFCGKDLEQMSDRDSAAQIGFVGQNPEAQIVTDTVWHELAFGLENLGMPQDQMRSRVAETAQYFGMSGWFRKPVATLSGGQKQLLNLAGVVAMRPKLLVLDEPTSQLDPIGAANFLQALFRLKQELGMTIFLSEQRLEEVLPMADQVLFMHQGRIAAGGRPQESSRLLREARQKIGERLPVEDGMPVVYKVYSRVCGEEQDARTPLTIGEGRSWLAGYRQERDADHTAASGSLRAVPEMAEEKKKQKNTKKQSVVLLAKELRYAYPNGTTVLDDFSIQVEKGEIYAILGGNGSGKTTALKLLAGIYQSKRGKVKAQGRVLYLAQNPLSLFTGITVQEELEDAVLPDEKEPQKLVGKMLERLDLTACREQNPMDLSGGQQQRLALGKILLRRPDVLLLDEPTKGMDAAFKQKLSGWMQQWVRQGMTVLMVSHDIEFCAENATRCGLLFDGQLISRDTTRAFFRKNAFYTTAAKRLTEGLMQPCLKWEEVVDALEE